MKDAVLALAIMLLPGCGAVNVNSAMPQLAASLESLKAVYSNFCSDQSSAVCADAKEKLNAVIDAYTAANNQLEE